MSSSDQQRNSEHVLSPKDLSILNVAILLTQNRSTELGAEIERAVRNGVSPDGVRAILDEVAARVGDRVADAIRVAEQTISDLERR
jgi:alkylhydroperoxidase/carboxymuconolactone decarboxylase family protein YurZ